MATDNCGLESVVKEEELMSGGCLGGYFRVFTATDECGNVATAEQYVALIDVTPPVIINPPNATYECDEIGMIPNQSRSRSNDYG